MAAHNYVYVSSSQDGDKVSITATVDGFSVTVDVSHALMSSFPNVTALRNYLAPLFYHAAVGKGLIPSDAPSADAIAATVGSFTQ